jgi:hypothetical protein
MATKNQSKATVVDLAKQLIAGTTKHLGNGTKVMLSGGSFTAVEITSKLNQLVTLRTDVDTAKAQTKAKLAAEKADMPALRTLMGALVTFVKAAYGNAPDVLADFGIHPKARTPLTVEAKVAAAAKRKATRAARKTLGSKQKKGVKGDVRHHRDDGTNHGVDAEPEHRCDEHRRDPSPTTSPTARAPPRRADGRKDGSSTPNAT